MMRKYAWADEDYDLAPTFAVATGVAVADVVRAYGGDPDRPVGGLTFGEAMVPAEEFGQYFQVGIREGDGYVVAIENNGWTGNVPEVARRLTRRDGRFSAFSGT